MTDDNQGGKLVEVISNLYQERADTRSFYIPTEGLGPGLPEYAPAYLDPQNKAAALMDVINAYRLLPQRRKGDAQCTNLTSFIALTTRHKDEDSALFVNADGPNYSMTAIIDYHRGTNAKHEPRWLEHSITYAFPLTKDFKLWLNNNGKLLTQFDFAQFLDENIAALISPTDEEQMHFGQLFRQKFATPADLITLSRELEIHVGKKIIRQERLNSGERLASFETEHKDSKGEPVSIPGLFMIALPPFIDSEALRMIARLRYRVSGGDVHWAYDLYKIDELIRARVIDEAQKASEQTGLPAYIGREEV